MAVGWAAGRVSRVVHGSPYHNPGCGSNVLSPETHPTSRFFKEIQEPHIRDLFTSRVVSVADVAFQAVSVRIWHPSVGSPSRSTEMAGHRQNRLFTDLFLE